MIEIPVLDLDGLLLTKQNSIRPKDIADVDMIRKMLAAQTPEDPLNDDEESLDDDYDNGPRR